MSIGVPRGLIVAMAAVFTLYNAVLCVYQLQGSDVIVPTLLALSVYLVTTAITLTRASATTLPWWLAAVDLAVVVAVPVLASVGRPADDEWAWYVSAAGILLVILTVRGRALLACAGTVFLVVQTLVWAGADAIVSTGVSAVVIWVAVSTVLSRAMAKAAKDARRFALAEREATDWQAAQEAHVFERQFRLGQTSSMALAMLRTIEQTDGELTEEQRRECLHLEAAIRDEIRGRRLLDDAVRREVMSARRRGASVSLLDEGGIDELGDAELARVHTEVARAIAGSAADRLIVRTVAEGSDIAVTVVGLRSSDAEGDEDDQVELWLEIPRYAV